jgi:hypothetical protein
VTRDRKVFIHWRGKQVRTLAGPAAEKFIAQVGKASAGQAQLLMARLTGNFKRGNERTHRVS